MSMNITKIFVKLLKWALLIGNIYYLYIGRIVNIS